MRAYMYSSVLTISLSDILSLLDKESNIVRGFENRPVYTNGSARSSLEHETLGQKEREGEEGVDNFKMFFLYFSEPLIQLSQTCCIFSDWLSIFKK